MTPINSTIIVLASSLASAFVVQAQSSGTGVFANEVKQGYNAVKNNLLKAAEKMPEENYSFKPVPEIRSFGALVAHIADAQTRFCSTVMGTQKTPNASSKTTKADIVAALKESTGDCDKAFESISDANATEMVKMGRMEMSKLGMLMRVVVHDNEEYGYLAVYMRLKNIVPPSSEGR